MVKLYVLYLCHSDTVLGGINENVFNLWNSGYGVKRERLVTSGLVLYVDVTLLSSGIPGTIYLSHQDTLGSRTYPNPTLKQQKKVQLSSEASEVKLL